MRLIRDCMWVFSVLFAALLSQPLAAQGGYPGSFMPMCVGEATWWMSTEGAAGVPGYTTPSFHGMDIEHDTLIEGVRYFYVRFPPDVPMDPGWMRSDRDGLYVWDGVSETMLLPARPYLGQKLIGGEVTQTSWVNAPFGEARTFSFSKSGHALTWADGVGLWEFSGKVGAGTGVYRFLSRHRCDAGPSIDPVGLNIPIRPHDILVHRLSSDEQPSLGYQILSARPGTSGRQWILATSDYGTWRPDRNYAITMTQGGIIRYAANDFYSNKPIYDYYPAYIPAVETLDVGKREMRVVARFDTTIFGEAVKAFTMKNDDDYGELTMTIADRFGLVYERDQGLESRLHSAVIDSVRYNRKSEKRRFMPLCAGSVFNYRRVGAITNDFGQTSMIDSTLDSIPRVQFRLPEIPVFSGTGMRYGVSGVFRENADGVLTDKGAIFVPYEADLGDPTGLGIVVSIEERELFGKKRWVMTTVDVAYDFIRADTLVEDIGLYATKYEEFYYGRFNWTLHNAVVCGEIINPTNGVDITPQQPSALSIELYPNPAVFDGDGPRVSIRSESALNGQLSVHDVLGRIRSVENISMIPGANNFLLRTRGLAPGMYIVSLRSALSTASSVLLLR